MGCPPAGLIVQVNDAEAEMPPVSLAVTIMPEVPARVGVPEISPVLALRDMPDGSTLALQVSGLPQLDVPCSCRLAGVPRVRVWFPGLVTVPLPVRHLPVQ